MAANEIIWFGDSLVTLYHTIPNILNIEQYNQVGCHFCSLPGCSSCTYLVSEMTWTPLKAKGHIGMTSFLTFCLYGAI